MRKRRRRRPPREDEKALKRVTAKGPVFDDDRDAAKSS